MFYAFVSALQCDIVKGGVFAVGTIPQALDPDELFPVDASFCEPQVSVLRYFEQFLVVAGYRCAW